MRSLSPHYGSSLGTAPRFAAWPAVLIAIVLVKALLSLLLKPDSLLASYGGVPYFLLLLLATGLAIRNGIENTQGGRPFWVLVASACSLWLVDQSIFLYYQFGPHIDVPDDSIADPVLFLHVALLVAAVATFPHRNTSERKLHGTILNALLVVTFWGFLYFYVVFPYRLSSNATGYALGFDALYLLENWALVLALGFLSMRAKLPWRSTYLHLLGASTLYALSSAVANLAIDSGGYVNGRLYGVGLTAAACWFVWMPLRAHQVAGTDLRVPRSDGLQRSRTSAWAMLAVVLISIPVVWELLRVDGAAGLRTFRIVVAVAAIVCLAIAAFLKEYFAKSDLSAYLSSASDRLRLAMESGKAVGWEWDLKSSQITWFGDLKTSFGIDSETHVERAAHFFERYVHSGDQQQVSEAVTDARRNHKVYEGEFRVAWPNGTQRWVTAKGEFRYSSKGKPERMLGIAVDITERKQLQTDLLDHQNRIAAIVECSDDAIISKSLDGIIWTWNRSAERLFGFSAAEAIGQPITIIIPDNLREEQANILRCLKAGERIDHYETTRLTKAGNTLSVSLTVSPLRDSSGVIIGACKMARDVTGKKHAERALRSSEERFRLFIDHSPAIAWMKDEDGHYVYMSEAYLQHFGIRFEDQQGKTDFEIYPHAIAEEFTKNDHLALSLGHPIEVTEDSIGLDGQPCTWLAYKFPFQDASGQLFAGGIGVDISERKKSEQALHDLTGRLISAQEEERTRIARELHDDFSQRLALLGIGLGQLWKKIPPQEVEQRGDVLDMLRATREISSDMHSLSHELHSSKLEHVGLALALTALCRDIALKYNIEVQFAQSKESLHIPKDVALCLFRVAQESLANVVKHSRAKTTHVELAGNASSVTLRISDSGIGWDTFAQKGGAGIGIISMRERLHLVGGTFLVTSQPGRGTEIFAEVPLVAQEKESNVKTNAAEG